MKMQGTLSCGMEEYMFVNAVEVPSVMDMLTPEYIWRLNTCPAHTPTTYVQWMIVFFRHLVSQNIHIPASIAAKFANFLFPISKVDA